MTTSSTDICNLALDLLSGGNVVNTEEPTTSQESLLKRWYNKSRKKVLREHPWNFASKRAVLAASSTAPAFGYEKQYPVPSDFIRLLALETEDGTVINPQEYQFENNAILYDGEDGAVYLRYICDFTDVVHMDALFIDLVVLEIALGIAFKVTGQKSVVENIDALIKERSPRAKAIDGQERPPQRVERSKSLTARRFGNTERSDRIVY